MFQWFRSRAAQPDTGVAMIGPRPGDQVVFVGADRPALAGECGAITGLNGRTVVVAQGPQAAKRIEAAAGKAGALLEFVDAPFDALPLDTGTFKLAVVPDLAAWPSWAFGTRIAEALRVLQPGGRIVVLAAQRRAGIFGALPQQTSTVAVDTVLTLFTNLGAVAGRRLAEVDGVAYYEARKPR
jgi:ubiquinone/menaquinone biosynthesis C-methylase UbiE